VGPRLGHRSATPIHDLVFWRKREEKGLGENEATLTHFAEHFGVFPPICHNDELVRRFGQHLFSEMACASSLDGVELGLFSRARG
jgi:hypothetical protein